MNRTIEGHFWLADSDEHQLRGRLTWTPTDGGELALEGAFLVESGLTGNADVVYGRALDGTPLVLFNSFVRRFQAASRVTQHWHVNEAIMGSAEPIPLTRLLAMELGGLDTFSDRSGLSITGTFGAREPAQIEWTPNPHPITVPVEGGEISLIDRRELDLSDHRFSVEDQVRLTYRPDDDRPFDRDAYGPLRAAAALFELFADRPLPVRREWCVLPDETDVEHLYRPVVGVLPDDPERFWLKLPNVADRLPRALSEWLRLIERKREMIDLVVEEVRFQRQTNTPDRILRLARILELLHRERHPDALPDPEPDAPDIPALLASVSPEHRGWLSHRLGAGQIRLRQRIRELLVDLDGGLDAVVIDRDQFAATVTRTRNWHTHYGNDNGIATGPAAAYLAMRLWLLTRATLLMELGWSASESTALLARDRCYDWLPEKPLR